MVWVWLVPILAAYLLAWMLPALKPRLSALLWQEQMAPETRIGRAVLAISLSLAPVAGVLGASMGMFASRLGEISASLIIGGTLMTMSSIGFAFAAAYQLWPERPWATDEGEHQGSV